MLLGLPPDMVHGAALRKTDPSLLLTGSRQHTKGPGAGIHPCCSGLQVQGTANSPTSAALPRVGRGFADMQIFYNTSAPESTLFCAVPVPSIQVASRLSTICRAEARRNTAKPPVRKTVQKAVQGSGSLSSGVR